MRERLKRLIVGLINSEGSNKEAPFLRYTKDQMTIDENCTCATDFDEINEKYFSYYLEMFLGSE